MSRWLKTNAALGCERPVLRLPIIKLLHSVICVHLSNLRPKLAQYLRVSVPLWQSHYADGLRFIAVRSPNHRWLETNAALGCEKHTLRLPMIKLHFPVICVPLSNLRPKLAQYLRVSVPLWQSNPFV